MPRVSALGALAVALATGLAVGFAACSAPGAQPGGPQIRTGAGSFDPLASRGPRIAGVDTEAVGPELPWIVQLAGHVTIAERQALKDAGATLVAYQPDDAFLVRATPGVAAGLKGVDGVRAVVPQSPALRIQPKLLVHVGGALQGPTSTRPTRLMIEVPGEDAQVAVAQAIRSLGGRIDQLSKSGHYLVATAPLSAATELAARSDVEWVQKAERFRFVNNEARWVIQAGSGAANVGLTPVWDQGLTGSGQIIGIADSGIAGSFQGTTFVSTSCFFTDQANKILTYQVLNGATAGDEMGHGTHTSGSLAGNTTNSTESAYDGQAKDAQLYFQDIGSNRGLTGLPANLATGLFPSPYAAGARIHSDSWGSSTSSYDAYAQQVDTFVAGHPDFLVAFANGNAGPAAGSVGSPATAKDLISVGATDNATPALPTRPDYMANADSAIYSNTSFSSRGPTADGRIKPTLTAPGAMVESANWQSACGVMADAGTSMATPTLAGGATLARQYFVEGFYPSGVKTAADAIDPSAALLKAVLIAGADPMDGPNAGTIPSMSQGFGRVNVGHALYFPGDPAEDRLWIHDDTTGLATGAARTFGITTDRSGPLKVALTWTDPAAAAGANPALVDDLDLTVTSPSGAVYKGNVLTGGASVTGGTADHLNVEEIVYLPAAPSGTWNLTVTGYNVPSGPQTFALAAVGEIPVTGQGAPGADPPPPPPPPVQPPKCTDATISPVQTAVGWVDANGGYATAGANNAFGDDDVYSSSGADPLPGSYGNRYGVIQVPINVPAGKTLESLTLTVTGQTAMFVTAGASWTFDAVAMPALSTATTYANVNAAGVLDTAPQTIPDLEVGRKVEDVLTFTTSAVDSNGLLTIRIHGNGTQGSMMSWDSGYPVGPGTGDTTPGLGIPPVIGLCFVGPPAKLAYTTASQTVTAGGCSGVVTVESEDSNGYASPVTSATLVGLSSTSGTMTFYSNATCTTAATGTTIGAGASKASFYFKDTTAGTPTVTASASGLGSVAQGETVNAGAPSALTYVTPARTVAAGACSGVVTVESDDANGNPSPVTTSTTVTLVSTSGTMKYFSDAGCTAQVTGASIAAGKTQGSFYFEDTTTGTPKITASATGLTQANQTETVTAAAPTALAFTTAAQTVTAGACSAKITVETRDAYGNAAPVTASTAVALSSTSGTMKFYSDAGCTTSTPGPTIAAGGSTGSFYFEDTAAGSPKITASATGLTSASQTEVVDAGAPAKLVFTTAAQTNLVAGACSAVVTVELEDAYGNPAAAGSSTTVALSSGSGTMKFFSDSACGTSTTGPTIAAGNATASFYLDDTTAGSPVVTAKAGSLPPATQTEMVSPAAASKLVFSTPARTVAAGGCSSVVTVETQDAYGNVSMASANIPVTLSTSSGTMKLFSDSACTTSTTGTTITAGGAIGSFYFMDTTAGSPAISAASGTLTQATQTETVTAATAAALAFTTPAQTVTAGACSGKVTVAILDTYGNPSPATATVAVGLTSGSGTLKLFSDAACSAAVTGMTVATGGSAASFYFMDTAAESPVITAAAASLTTATQSETVDAGPPSVLAFTTPARSFIAGSCSGKVSVEAEDANGNPSVTATASTVTLSSSSGTMTFYSDAACTTAETSVGIAAGSATGSFYVGDTTAGSPVVTGKETGLSSATQTETVVAKLTLTPIADQTVNENALLDLTATLASDPGTATPVYAITGLPTGATFDTATGHLTWTPTYQQSGTYPMTISVTESGQSDSTSFTVTVNNVDTPPVLAPVGAQSVVAGSTLTFTVSATDPDGDTVTITDSGAPAASTFDGTTFTWTPTASDVGTVTVTFTASDGNLQDAEQVDITVTQNGGTDGGTVGDGGTGNDGGTVGDGGTTTDGGTKADGGTTADGGAKADGGGGGASAPGCGCSTSSGTPAGLVPVVLGLLGLAITRRRRWP